MSQAKKLDATYADIRINRCHGQFVGLRSTPDLTTGKLNHVPMVGESQSFGFGVRVIVFVRQASIMLNDVRKPCSSLLRIAPLTAFDPAAGTFLGQLKDASGKVITNPPLWALVPF